MGAHRMWAGLAGLVVFFLLLYVLRGVLMPFAAGLAVAYFLDPVADRLERLGCSRTVAVALIMAVFFLAVVTLLILLVPVLQAQVAGFAGRLPSYVDSLRSALAPLYERLAAALPADGLARLQAAAQAHAADALKWLAGLIGGLFRGGAAFLNVLSLIVIMPLVAFYMLRDWDRIVASVDGLLPRHVAPTVREVAADVDRTLSAFVRGQATVCLIQGIYYAIGLSVVGLEFGLVVGLATGLLTFIPYFGMGLGLVVGVGIALAQFSSWMPIASVVGVFAVGQFVEGNFLTPRLVGERVGLHPVWVIFALLTGGVLFGFTGVILSIPVAASGGVLVRFAAARYRQSDLYTDDGDGEVDGKDGDAQS